MLDRYIFCGYWLYFNGIRSIFGEIRELDYIGFCLILFGLARFIGKSRFFLKITWIASIFFLPLIVVIVFNPTVYIVFNIVKLLIAFLYFTIYLKTIKFGRIEWLSFAIPLVVSFYYFVNPRDVSLYQLSLGRFSGISDPNFTSLSLLIAMVGCFGYFYSCNSSVKKNCALCAMVFCAMGIVITASRAGFIGLSIAIMLFLLIEKKVWCVSILCSVVMFIFASILSNFSIELPLVFSRFYDHGGNFESIFQNTSSRDILSELAWSRICSDDWFVGGGPRNVSLLFRGDMYVPHNSFLDIGLAYGRFPFYFYSAIVVMLLILNLWEVRKISRCKNFSEKESLLIAIFFLSLLPMYLSLSAGLTLGFVFWVTLGSYPLLCNTHSLLKINNRQLFLRK